MAERKQRIMRRYLRESATVTQGMALVPQEVDKKEADETRTKAYEPQMPALQRPVQGSMPPPVAIPMPVQQDENWLLGDDSSTDPFSIGGKDDASTGKGGSGSAWDAFGGHSKQMDADTGRRSDFGTERASPTTIQRPQGIFDPHRTDAGDSRASFFGARSAQPDARPSTGLYSPPATTRSPFPTGTGVTGGRIGASVGNTPGVNDQTGLFNLPERGNPAATDRQGGWLSTQQRTQQSPGAFYKPPAYQSGTDRRQSSWGAVDEADQEFKRADPYQQWKQRSTSPLDPTKKDYINETLPTLKR